MNSVPRARAAVLLVAGVFGFLAGSFQIFNTSAGWHLASGRWILEHDEVPRADPFSFTAEGTPWLDHEWLFQVLMAAVEQAGGAPALVVLRGLLTAALAILLAAIGLRSGLRPVAALLLTVACVWGARMRFFLRPELVTLLVVPAVLWLYLSRADRKSHWWIAALAALAVLGANAHAGALILPVLMGGIFVAEVVRFALERRLVQPALWSGVVALAATGLAMLVNPGGLALYGVPLKITHLTGLPHIPNPEWIAPSVAQVPWLYAGLVFGAIVLAARERDPARWMLFIMAGALALRFVRNTGLFFVLLPLAIAPALVRLPGLGCSAESGGPSRLASRALQAGVWTLTPLVALWFVVAPWPSFGFGLSAAKYPVLACDFMEQAGLREPFYNDVNFGGYLLGRFPDRRVFLDDRNEIHEPLLREIWEIFQRSDRRGWNAMLERYGIDAALVRYHHALRVLKPSGEPLGMRGFSALWFPKKDWALVYWDDVAMVFVRRSAASPELLDSHEYRVARPDDADHLLRGLTDGSVDRASLAAELERKLEEDHSCQKAWSLYELVAAPRKN